MDAGNVDQMHIDGESDDSVEEVVPEAQPQGVQTTQTQKKRKLTSQVWKSFTFLKQEPGQPLYCACKKCGKKYNAESSSGTGNLIRHRKKCIKMTTKDMGQFLISSSKGVLDTKSPKFNQEQFREFLINAIIRHDLPFSFTEYEGIRNIFKYLQPSVTNISRNTAKSDIRKLYACESKRLRDELIRCPSRISLTSDAWTSIVTDGYLSLIAHYIDSNWVLQKRILNFSYMPPPHTGIALAEKISGLVQAWGIENKLFSITLDNASSNDVCVDVLKNQFRLMNSLVCDGKLFHLRCCAHILNLIVQDGLKEIDVSVEKIRECVKYVKGSQRRKEKFTQCCSQNRLDCKKALTQDVPTRWNSTYRMLSSAIYYRLAFSHLGMSDSSFQSCPSTDEWERVGKICDFLGFFYEATVEFSGSLYPTSNLFFPKVFLIHLKLVEELKSSDIYMKKIAGQMWVKFNKYWADFNLLLAIAVVFDPRYKYSFVKFSYEKLYGDDSLQLKTVRETLDGLFLEYTLNSKNSTGNINVNSEQVNNEEEYSNQSILKEFDQYDNNKSSSSSKQSQLDLYLLEPRAKTTSTISILDFWKSQQYRYPDLARLAMDILCVPVSTVASESAFSLGGRILDQYRSTMSPSTVEALICTRDWLFTDKDKGNAHIELEEITKNVMDMKLDNTEAE